MYKTSFNGLKVSVEGVYSAYNLSSSELESLKRYFGADKINGSKGNYTVYKEAKRKVFLELFVHEVWILISFDIRKDLLNLYGSNRIFSKDIETLSKKLKEKRIQINVEYDYFNNQWYIVEYDKFLELLKTLI